MGPGDEDATPSLGGHTQVLPLINVRAVLLLRAAGLMWIWVQKEKRALALQMRWYIGFLNPGTNCIFRYTQMLCRILNPNPIFGVIFSH